MLYAQFYQKSAISDEIIEASGDRSVIILDARYALETNKAIADEWAKKRNYLGWALFSGETFTRSNRITSVQRI